MFQAKIRSALVDAKLIANQGAVIPLNLMLEAVPKSPQVGMAITDSTSSRNEDDLSIESETIIENKSDLFKLRETKYVDSKSPLGTLPSRTPEGFVSVSSLPLSWPCQELQ